jgi:hypothetical protein
VILPYVSTVIDGYALVVPYVPAVAPEVGKRKAFNVPDEILAALVVSVVAEAARPDTALLAIAILVFVTDDTRPYVSTANTGTEFAVP